MPRWVTVFGRVNHLRAKQGTQAYSAWVCLCAGWNEYLAKAGRVNRHIAWYTSPYPWYHSVRRMPGCWLASGDQRRLTGSGSALEPCSRRCAKSSLLYFTLLYFCFFNLTLNSGVLKNPNMKLISTPPPTPITNHVKLDMYFPYIADGLTMWQCVNTGPISMRDASVDAEWCKEVLFGSFDSGFEL